MKLPDSHTRNYGRDMYSQGYGKGYSTCEWDHKKRRLRKEQDTFRGFCKFLDYIDDILANQRKR